MYDCARGRSDTTQGPQRSAGGAEQAERRPRIGGLDEYKRGSAEHLLSGVESSQSKKTKAQKRIELDLDDGVKVNYGKLGAILAKVKGLNG
jgi:hypothetical protein